MARIELWEKPEGMEGQKTGCLKKGLNLEFLTMGALYSIINEKIRVKEV